MDESHYVKMDDSLLKAAMEDTTKTIENMSSEMLLGERTGRRNTCLHIACIYGHSNFCKEVLKQDQSSSLLSVKNKDGETPLLTAVMSGHVRLANDLLEFYCEDDVLIADKNGYNVLHHAIRGGHTDLALKLIDKAPALSSAQNKYGESPMFLAVLRGFTGVFEKLLSTAGSCHCGAHGYNALHAAVKYGHADIAKKIMDRRPGMAKDQDHKKDTPMDLAAHFNEYKILSVMLKCDSSLGYAISGHGNPLLVIAAKRGHVGFARELLNRCPDAPYCREDTGWTCLHEAVEHNRMEFVEFILTDTRLQKIINMQDDIKGANKDNKRGDSALHIAVRNCNSKMVSALLCHGEKSSCKMDVTAISRDGCAAVWRLGESHNYAKTMSWNKIAGLILDFDDRAKNDIYNLYEQMRNEVIAETKKDVKSLTNTYTQKTSLVAILIASITFAAAFKLPGGYISDTGSDGGLPIMARKHAYAFQAFLISDTLAMASSLAVAFICVIAKWTDFEFLIKYRHITKNLMWFAYMTTTLAFASGLYTVLAPHLHWLAIAVCVLSVLLPIFTVLLFHEWFILGPRIRRGKGLSSDFLKMV